MDNNTLDWNSEMAKIVPIYSSMNVSFMKYEIFHDGLSADKSMVPYD